jgi:hypothetical protein
MKEFTPKKEERWVNYGVILTLLIEKVFLPSVAGRRRRGTFVCATPTA